MQIDFWLKKILKDLKIFKLFIYKNSLEIKSSQLSFSIIWGNTV